MGNTATVAAEGLAVWNWATAIPPPPPTLSFSQTTASPWFSSDGTFSGSTISDVSSQLRTGDLTPEDVPVQTVTIDGYTLIVNTRSSARPNAGGYPAECLDFD